MQLLTASALSCKLQLSPHVGGDFIRCERSRFELQAAQLHAPPPLILKINGNVHAVLHGCLHGDASSYVYSCGGVRVAARGDNDGDEDASASAALAAAAADVEDVTLHVATRCSSQ